MGKLSRKWINFGWGSNDCVRAEDVPYDSSYSIKSKMDMIKTGRSSLLTDDNNKQITFSNLFLDINYSLSITFLNIIDQSPTIYNYVITSKLTNGFTVTFSNLIDSDNYILEWVAIHDS